MKATVIGLGHMGWGAAVSLLRAGIETTGCDLVEETLERFRDRGGNAFPTPAEAVPGSKVVLVFVLNAQQAKSVLFGSRGAVSAADLGTVFLLNATMSPAEVETIAADLTAAGMAVIDAPVTGGAARAESGELTVLASGPDAAFDKAAPALDAIAARIFRLGSKPGTAARMKMVNQLLAGAHVAAMAEALVLAMREGLEPAQVIEVIGESSGASEMFRSRAPQVAEGDYTPITPVDVLAKDLGIAKEAAGYEMPLTEAALALLSEAQDAGFGSMADAAVARIIARRAGVTLPGESRDTDG
ncbi:NAD(P)-dependent oxidoreductase [Halovulum dunhuangense]|uniref:NAD(P)-dependent oxidoreductase n=1 Tax=Halovulum dunhuangense TaxID=1505036 RepID=A0A849L0V5_9RHOB|nr:NAD(P)-dependent oxidoreductase [Halovulum dunhuangense]NNU79859.1 NAD(P)-dependent oxidoreductase [Halovulum dunhuangense]